MTPGDFSTVSDEHTRMMYEDMYAAITAAEAWNWMCEDPGEGGYMFSSHPMSAKINSCLNDRTGHSGSSYAWTMRSMQNLAKLGWDNWILEVNKKSGWANMINAVLAQ